MQNGTPRNAHCGAKSFIPQFFTLHFAFCIFHNLFCDHFGRPFFGIDGPIGQLAINRSARLKQLDNLLQRRLVRQLGRRAVVVASVVIRARIVSGRAVSQTTFPASHIARRLSAAAATRRRPPKRADRGDRGRQSPRPPNRETPALPLRRRCGRSTCPPGARFRLGIDPIPPQPFSQELGKRGLADGEIADEGEDHGEGIRGQAPGGWYYRVRGGQFTAHLKPVAISRRVLSVISVPNASSNDKGQPCDGRPRIDQSSNLTAVCHCLEQAVPGQRVTRGTACSKQWHTVGQSPRVARNAAYSRLPSPQSPVSRCCE